MKIKTFHIRLSKEHLSSDEQNLNEFLKDKTIINTFAELVKTDKVNFWSIVITYFVRNENNNGKISHDRETELSQSEKIIFKKLKEWRAEEALKKKVPSYVIAHDTELITIAKENIQNIIELQNIKGFSDKKIAKYGADLIKILTDK